MPDIELLGAVYPDVPAVDLPKSGGGTARFYDPNEILYAGSATSGGSALNSEGIPYGTVDGTSTSTAYTATVPGITELKDGTIVMLKNGVVTSEAGFTINVNNLGAHPAYSNMAAATAETTIFNINYTMMFVYDSTRGGSGGWVCYRGYDSNTNTIGYQLRTNSATRPASDKGYRYRLWFTSADGTEWVPANTSTATNATTARTLNTRPIDPFGPIGYYSTNGTTDAGANPGATTMWEQYTLTIGYSYMASGFALITNSPVYVKATPQSDGSAVMSTIVSALPSTDDGFIYIYLGMAYSTTAMELRPVHPVYYHDGTGIRMWTGATAGASITVDSALSPTSENPVQNKVINSALALKYEKPSGGIPASDLASGVIPAVPSASTVTPAMDGAASAGSSAAFARGDHVHPHDTSKQDVLVSGTNLKTINNESLLGSGNIDISGGTTGGYAETLWENASPGSTFASQTVTLSEEWSNYDYILVTYIFSTSTADRATLLIPVSESIGSGNPDYSMRINAATSNRTGGRSITLAKRLSGADTIMDTVSFGTAAYNASSTNNGYAVPIIIYGIKLNGLLPASGVSF